MSDKQIQPIRSRDYQITQRARPRSLWGQSWMVLLQPGYFFRTLPLMQDTRSWLWAALLILALTGITAVRQEAMLNGENGSLPSDFGTAPPGTDLGGGGGSGPISGDSGGGGGIVSIPGDPGLGGDIGPPPTQPANPGEISARWTTALITAFGVVLGWFVLAALLSEVSLFNGRAPSLGQNLQVAIWASVPLAVMAGLQLIYYSVGGGVGEPGVAGLLAEWDAYTTFSPFIRGLLLSLTSRLTLFWLWTLVLIYVGARSALQGKHWAVIIVVVAWAVLVVVAPVITGQISMADQGGLTEFTDSMMTSPELTESDMLSPEVENLLSQFADAENAASGGALLQATAEPDTDDETAVNTDSTSEADLNPIADLTAEVEGNPIILATAEANSEGALRVEPTSIPKPGN